MKYWVLVVLILVGFNIFELVYLLYRRVSPSVTRLSVWIELVVWCAVMTSGVVLFQHIP